MQHCDIGTRLIWTNALRNWKHVKRSSLVMLRRLERDLNRYKRAIRNSLLVVKMIPRQHLLLPLVIIIALPRRRRRILPEVVGLRHHLVRKITKKSHGNTKVLDHRDAVEVVEEDDAVVVASLDRTSKVVAVVFNPRLDTQIEGLEHRLRHRHQPHPDTKIERLEQHLRRHHQPHLDTKIERLEQQLLHQYLLIEGRHRSRRRRRVINEGFRKLKWMKNSKS
mmetsp:Transcript_21010/g.31135  ORF Transcript_21010/g.31135 Transcript_21010/m.31135 type:complete len:222 (-) Transcript_21010:42-707(-)